MRLYRIEMIAPETIVEVSKVVERLTLPPEIRMLLGKIFSLAVERVLELPKERTEPCDVCESGFSYQKPVNEKGKMSKLAIANFCPNCGRKL